MINATKKIITAQSAKASICSFLFRRALAVATGPILYGAFRLDPALLPCGYGQGVEGGY